MFFLLGMGIGLVIIGAGFVSVGLIRLHRSNQSRLHVGESICKDEWKLYTPGSTVLFEHETAFGRLAAPLCSLFHPATKLGVGFLDKAILRLACKTLSKRGKRGRPIKRGVHDSVYFLFFTFSCRRKAI